MKAYHNQVHFYFSKHPALPHILRLKSSVYLPFKNGLFAKGQEKCGFIGACWLLHDNAWKLKTIHLKFKKDLNHDRRVIENDLAHFYCYKFGLLYVLKYCEENIFCWKQ